MAIIALKTHSFLESPVRTLLNLKHEDLSQVFSELPPKGDLGLSLLIIDQVYKTTLSKLPLIS